MQKPACEITKGTVRKQLWQIMFFVLALRVTRHDHKYDKVIFLQPLNKGENHGRSIKTDLK